MNLYHPLNTILKLQNHIIRESDPDVLGKLQYNCFLRQTKYSVVNILVPFYPFGYMSVIFTNSFKNAMMEAENIV